MPQELGAKEMQMLFGSYLFLFVICILLIIGIVMYLRFQNKTAKKLGLKTRNMLLEKGVLKNEETKTNKED